MRVAEWWRSQPLRSRIAAAVAATVAVTIGVAVTVAYVAVGRELNGQIEEQLRNQARQLQQQAAFSQARGFPEVHLRPTFGGYLQLVDPGGQSNRPPDQVVLPIDAGDLTVAAAQRGERIRDVTVDGTEVRVLTAPLTAGYAVQLALPVEAVHEQLDRLAVWFTLLAVVAIAVTVGLAWLLTRTALTPVAELTGAAERIARTRDLTHRIADDTRGDEVGRLAASFNAMLDALQRSLEAQRQLVVDASHELRTPLTSLRTNSEVLRQFDRLSPGQREEAVAGIVGQLEELTTLVGDVVELARGEEPGHQHQPVALEELVERTAAQAQRHWPTVRFDVSTEPVTVVGAVRRLERAVANLLDNAAKFSPREATVTVGLSADGTLVVRDHGPGIPEADLARVFERFYRADEARALPGSGLGLAIVKQVAEAHGGTVGLTNAPDGGLLATLRLVPVQPTPTSG